MVSKAENSNSGSAPVTQAVELLLDGGFETSTAGNHSWTYASEVGGWKSDTAVETWGKNFNGVKASQGEKIAELDFDGRQSNIYQEVKTEEGAEYAFKFDYMKRPGSNVGSDTVEVFWNGKLVGSVDPAKSEWSSTEFKVVGTGGNDRIEFREAAGDNDTFGGLLDNASLKKSGPSTAEKVAAEKAAAEANHSDLHMGDNTVNKLVGDDHVSVMFGEGGKDVLIGNGGDDVMHGGGGDDQMSGDDGNDLMFGSSTASGQVDMTKFRVSEDTTAKVTFNYEAAGYKNALGLYKIASDGTISGVQILFANASLKGSGGDLVANVSSLDVGLIAGEKLGFFAVPDGFSQRGMAELLSDKSATYKFVGADGKAGNVNSGSVLKLVQVDAKGQETVVKSAYGTSIFHSVDNGSAGLNGDNLNHAVGTVNNIDGTVKIGFEDLLGGGDKDYDDSVFTVSMGVINTSLLAKVATKAAAGSDKDVMNGGNGSDKMFGMADNDKMSGHAGDDAMWGNVGDDTMSGGDGNDYMSGGKGNDVISDDNGNDTVLGNSGDDRFLAGEGDDSYDGGSGFDTIDYSGAKNGMLIDLNAHMASGMGADQIKGVESVIGSTFADTISGDKNNNVLVGGAGDDTLRGRGGADVLSGGAGRDTFSWSKKDVNAVDHITDFAKGDRLNLHDLIKGEKFTSITDVVKVTDSAAGSTVSVKFDGAFHEVATLDGVHNTSAAELLKAGMILS